jgi:hypothetical protein
MKITAETYRQYVDRLRKVEKLKYIDEGAFGTVFQHPTMPNVVAKVVKRDPANYKWLAFCRDNPSNPWLPKLYSITHLELDDAKKAYVVFMEKLKEARRTDFWETIEAIGMDAPLPDPGTNLDDPKAWKCLSETTKDKNLAKVALYFSTQKWETFDIRPDNCMLRGHQFVFVDPLA